MLKTYTITVDNTVFLFTICGIRFNKF